MNAMFRPEAKSSMARHRIGCKWKHFGQRLGCFVGVLVFFTSNDISQRDTSFGGFPGHGGGRHP
jgi:hypothetical protein